MSRKKEAAPEVPYRTTRYRCSRCARVIPIEGLQPGTYMSWTEPEVDIDAGPTGEGILAVGVYCPDCRGAVEGAAGQIESFVI